MRLPLVVKIAHEIIFRPIILKSPEALWHITFFIKWRGHFRRGWFSFRRNYPNWVLKLGIVEIAKLIGVYNENSKNTDLHNTRTN